MNRVDIASVGFSDSHRPFVEGFLSTRFVSNSKLLALVRCLSYERKMNDLKLNIIELLEHGFAGNSKRIPLDELIAIAERHGFTNSRQQIIDCVNAMHELDVIQHHDRYLGETRCYIFDNRP